MTSKRILLFILGVLLLTAFIFFLSTTLQKNQKPVSVSPTPTAINFNIDYSSINKIFPGKSTTEDVKKINGEPVSVVVKNDKTYFYYQTPSLDFKNTVVFQNKVELFATENIFGGYRGDYNSFTKAYGQPNLTLYDNTSPFIWQIFLQQGIGVETNGKDILQIIYFVPENENSFMGSVGKELGLLKEKPASEVLRP